MRKQFPKTIEEVMAQDPKVVVILGDIGVFGFRNVFSSYPDRIYNIGILEQSTISVAAGLSKTGFIPVVHTIAPFIVERALEQLKDDFAFQAIGGNFVSVGGSYDYAALGSTHHCPADIGILKNIPGMEIVLPGTAEEFDRLFKESYNNGRPTYFRLAEHKNEKSYSVSFGKAFVIKKGKLATVVAVGEILDKVLQATEGQDVTVLYYTTLEPFDTETLKQNISERKKILICEPYYEGALTDQISDLFEQPVIIKHAGMPKRFLSFYGNRLDHDGSLGLTVENISEKLKSLLE